MLTNRKAYVEEDKYLTIKKMRGAQLLIKGKHVTVTNVRTLADKLAGSSDILARYEEQKRRNKYRRGKYK